MHLIRPDWASLDHNRPWLAVCQCLSELPHGKKCETTNVDQTCDHFHRPVKLMLLVVLLSDN